MVNILILAKKYLDKFKKSKKFRLFVIAMAAKLLVSLIVLAIVGYWACQPNETEAAGLSTKITQVKTANSSTVYYLDYKRGFKKAYVSAAAYLSYGNKWSSIKTVSKAELVKLSDVHLIKSKNSNKVYYITNGQKALIGSAQQFINSGFRWSDIVTVSETDINGYKTIDFSVIKLATLNSAKIGGGQIKNGLLTVATVFLDNSSQYIPTGTRDNIVAAFRFEASGKDAAISRLTFTRQGVSSDQAIGALYLTDEDGNLIGDKDSLNNKQFNLNLTGQPIVVPAGQNKIFYLKSNINPVSNVLGQTLKFGLLNATDIGADVAVGGSFPILGSEFKLVDGTSNLGQLKATSLAVNSNGEILIGSTNRAVAAFRFSETSGNEDVYIKKITLINIGSAHDYDLSDLVLVTSGGQVVAKANATAGQKATFTFSKGLFIYKNQSVDLTLKINVVNGEGRNIKFVISSDQDLTAVDADNYSLAVINDPALSGDDNNFLIKRAPIFLTATTLKDSQRYVYRDQNDAFLGSFELRNNTSDIKLSSLNVKIVKSGSTPSLDRSVTIFDAQSGKELGVVNAGKIDDNFGEIYLGNYAAAKGKTIKLELRAHIPETADSGDSYQVFVNTVNYFTAYDNILRTDNVSLAGPQMEVVRPSLYFYTGTIGADDLAVAGRNKVVLGAFKLEAVKEEDLTITEITVTNATGYDAVNYANGFTNLALYQGGSRISEVIAQPNANSYIFSNLNSWVKAGTSVNLYVKADLAGNADGTVKLLLESAKAKGRGSKISAEVNNQNIFSPEVAITHTALTVSSLSGGSFVAGQKNNEIASFNFTNNSAEKVKLNKAVIDSGGFMGNLSYNNGFSNLKFVYTNNNGKPVQAGSNLGKPVADVNEIGLNGFTLEPGQNITLSLYVDAASNIPTGQINLFIRDIQARGKTSDVYAQVYGTPTASVGVLVSGAITNSEQPNSGLSDSVSQTISFIKPVSGPITFGFHDPDYPYIGTMGQHTGMDIYTVQGTPVKAAADGIVTEAFVGSGDQASDVIIKYSSSLSTKYVHLSRINVKVGDRVKQGGIIGLSGGTPGTPGAGAYTNGPHLHFEVLLNGAAVDPQKYL